MDYSYNNLSNDEKNIAIQRAYVELHALWYHLVPLYGSVIANYVSSEISKGFFIDMVMLGRYLDDPRRANTDNGAAACSWLLVIAINLEEVVVQGLELYPYVPEAGGFWCRLSDFEYCWGAKAAFDLRQIVENFYWGLDIEPSRSYFQSFIRDRWALFHPQESSEGAAARADSPWDSPPEDAEKPDDPLDYYNTGDN